MNHDKESAVVASASGGFACARNINFVAESWEVTMSVITPHEAFVPGCTTSVVLRCGLYLSSLRLRMSLSELQSPSVSLDALDENGAVIQSSSLKVTFDDSGDLVLPWIYSTGCSALRVNLTATVKPRSTVNGSTHISACASVSMPPSPSSYQPETAANIQAAATRRDIIVPHLRLSGGKYWLDVGCV